MNIDKLKQEIGEFLDKLGYALYNLEFKKKSKNSVLTIYIDGEEDITIDDCVKVTHELNPFLDELDPIETEYFLEVSSPGAEKELRNENSIKKAIGKFVHLETDEQKVEGYLEAFDGDEITLKVGKKNIVTKYKEVNLIRLAIKF